MIIIAILFILYSYACVFRHEYVSLNARSYSCSLLLVFSKTAFVVSVYGPCLNYFLSMVSK